MKQYKIDGPRHRWWVISIHLCLLDWLIALVRFRPSSHSLLLQTQSDTLKFSACRDLWLNYTSIPFDHLANSFLCSNNWPSDYFCYRSPTEHDCAQYGRIDAAGSEIDPAYHLSASHWEDPVWRRHPAYSRSKHESFRWEEGLVVLHRIWNQQRWAIPRQTPLRESPYLTRSRPPVLALLH